MPSVVLSTFERGQRAHLRLVTSEPKNESTVFGQSERGIGSVVSPKATPRTSDFDDDDDELDVNTQDGTVVSLSGKQTNNVLRMHRQSLKSLPNMVDLKDLTDPAMLHNLRLRFLSEQYFTCIGNILIFVNPFKETSLYTPEMELSYRTVSKGRGLRPHIFRSKILD